MGHPLPGHWGGAVHGAPFLGCEGPGLSSMGPPRVPFSRSACASQPRSSHRGGAVLWGPPPAQILGGSQPLLPLWDAQIPSKEQHPPNSRCPGGLQLPSSQKPRDSPRQPQTRGSGEGKPPGDGNFALLAPHRATRGISFRLHLRRIPSFFPPIPARGGLRWPLLPEPREAGALPGAGRWRGERSLLRISLIFGSFFGVFFFDF